MTGARCPWCDSTDVFPWGEPGPEGRKWECRECGGTWKVRPMRDDNADQSDGSIVAR